MYFFNEAKDGTLAVSDAQHTSYVPPLQVLNFNEEPEKGANEAKTEKDKGQ